MPANAGGRGIPMPRIDAPRSGLAPRVLTVASDGSGLCGSGRTEDRGITPDSLVPLVEDDAAGLRERAEIPVRAMALSARDADDLAAQLCDLPSDTGAIFLTHTDPSRARAVRRTVREAGGPQVVTEADTIAITLTATLLTAVARAGRSPETSRVVIAGSAAMPDLCPLLITVGIGDISSWNASDAHVFPLRHIARQATAVIDLIGATAGRAGWVSEDRATAVISADDPRCRLLPAPGLFAALRHYPNATVDVDVFLACVMGLVAATPLGLPVPELDDPYLAEVITSAVLRVLAGRAGQSHPYLPTE